MSSDFEELDYRPTPMGALSLRRRRDRTLGIDIFEIKLGADFLMSSRFTASEIALARLGLAGTTAACDVVVGGLGLGYTAHAALAHPGLRSLLVVEALAGVIEWHQEGLLELGAALTGDPRCRIVHGDFFAMAAAPDSGFDPERRGRRFHAILLDIDHSPHQVLAAGHAALYLPEGLHRLAGHLHPGGVFALWSNDEPDAAFGAVLREVFPEVAAHAVAFWNPLQGREATNTIYVARTPARLA